jgi:agmatinase
VDNTVKDLHYLIEQLAPGMVALVGVPWDENSSFTRGPAQAPARIREALYGGSSNLCSETGVDLGQEARFRDLGDLKLGGDAVLIQIEEVIDRLLGRGASVLAIGGDHAITYPIIRAYRKKFNKLNILHLDAHPDLYEEYEGNRLSNACPFARIMEENLAGRLVQVGIRTLNPHQRDQAQRFGVEIVEMRDFHPELSFGVKGPVYLSLDLDVLDPAYAPGVSHHEPGGLSTREVLKLIQGLHAPLVGADVVEYNPDRDPLAITAAVAAKFVKEIAASMIESN